MPFLLFSGPMKAIEAPDVEEDGDPLSILFGFGRKARSGTLSFWPDFMDPKKSKPLVSCFKAQLLHLKLSFLRPRSLCKDPEESK